MKTYVGSEWCGFGTRDSTGLGVKLEKLTWGSWTPHKFKFAVSGCPRNCAEATIKDMGVVCVEAGCDLMLGGNGGIDVRVTDRLAQVEDGRRSAGIPPSPGWRRSRMIAAPTPGEANRGCARARRSRSRFC